MLEIVMRINVYDCGRLAFQILFKLFDKVEEKKGAGGRGKQ
jgi:hypothetical protein